MKLWVLEAAETGLTLDLPNKTLLSRMLENGISMSTARKAILSDTGDDPVLLQVIGLNGSDCQRPLSRMPDVLFLGWMPVFSESAVKVFVAAGCRGDDFVLCRLRAKGVGRRFIHLPESTADIIDFGASKFGHMLPLDPPFPFHVLEAVVVAHAKAPPCFRVGAPGQTQILPELFVTEPLLVSWRDHKLSGASFRNVSTNYA